MLQSIFTKEWLKTRLFLIIYSMATLGLLAYLLLSIHSTLVESGRIEVWATMIGRDMIFVDLLKYVPLVFGVALALTQWLPEMINKRLKLTLHLPVSAAQSIGCMLCFGVVATIILTIICLVVLSIVEAFWFPGEIILHTLRKLIPAFCWGTVIYLVSSWIMLEVMAAAIRTTIMPHTKYVVIGLIVVLCCFFHTQIERLIMPQPLKTPFVLYSNLDSTFIRFETQDRVTRYIDFRGKEWTKHQTDSLLPLFSYRQLVAEDRLPDTICGHYVTPKIIQRNNFHFKTSPKQLNYSRIPLYTMLESRSGLVNLVLPPDVFRLTNTGLEFIDCESNKVLKAKSISFTRELEKHGFIFPVKLIWGNASTRKNYDNGFLLTDQNDRLFQLTMQRGIPTVREVITDGQRWRQLFTIEPANMELIGLVVSSDNQLYAVRQDATLAHIDIDEYDPQTMQITIVGDMLQWTITLYTEHDTRYYAVNPLSFELFCESILQDP